MRDSVIKIISYQRKYALYFEHLNKAWIEESYSLEPTEKYLLENPEEAILNLGGSILFAKHEGQIIGTVALKPIAPGIVELTKLAVDKQARGLGAGELLCKSAIEEASKMNVEKVILYSNTRQATAINLYRKMGFTEVPVEPGVYERANIKMEFTIAYNATKEETYINPIQSKQKYDDSNSMV